VTTAMSVLPGRITVKHVLKRGAGVASTWLRPFVAPTSLTRACILMYHRVAPVPFVDPHLDNWNVTPAGFERQIAALAESAELVALGDLPALFAAPPRGRGSKPLVCLTFDDGFANFHSHALPILRRYHAPATLFVVTAFVGSPDPMPFDRWSKRYCRDLPPAFWRPIAWQDLDDCVATGLVTIGSHSHRHRRGIDCAPGELREEAEESRAILRRRLGDAHAAQFSYPYGCTRPRLVTGDYVGVVRAAGYSTAVSTDLGLASAICDPWFLPRIEAFGLDSPAVLRAKVEGALAPYEVPQWFRAANRSA